mmetsp:Transcript_33668/g.81889  ORF Transcript_33668/g.81889 Transcript_33668/m.81889 type:complete len:92 (-) Transcript_33668:544-819(-)
MPVRHRSDCCLLVLQETQLHALECSRFECQNVVAFPQGESSSALILALTWQAHVLCMHKSSDYSALAAPPPPKQLAARCPLCQDAYLLVSK